MLKVETLIFVGLRLKKDSEFDPKKRIHIWAVGQQLKLIKE
jgi:hypothetical protein